MEAFSALLAHCEGTSPVTSEFPSQRPVTRSFVVFFDLRLSKWLSKPPRRLWFETPLRSLWRHCNEHIEAEAKWPPLRRWYFQVHFLVWKNKQILNYISLKCVLYGVIENMAALVQLMAFHRAGDRPLSEPMLLCCTEAYMRHPASVSPMLTQTYDAIWRHWVITNYSILALEVCAHHLDVCNVTPSHTLITNHTGNSYGMAFFNSSPPGENGRHIGIRQFEMHFLESKWQNSDSNVTEICSQESNWR